MKLLNLTPHEVVCHVNDYVTITVAREILSARVATETIAMPPIMDEVGSFELPMFATKYGNVENLPEPENNTYYIVSRMVKTASIDRTDLLVPSGLVRDALGVIIGCRGFE